MCKEKEERCESTKEVVWRRLMPKIIEQERGPKNCWQNINETKRGDKN
jgi:hypothetical protein